MGHGKLPSSSPSPSKKSKVKVGVQHVEVEIYPWQGFWSRVHTSDALVRTGIHRGPSLPGRL